MSSHDAVTSSWSRRARRAKLSITLEPAICNSHTACYCDPAARISGCVANEDRSTDIRGTESYEQDTAPITRAVVNKLASEYCGGSTYPQAGPAPTDWIAQRFPIQ